MTQGIVEFIHSRLDEDGPATSALHHDLCDTHDDFSKKPCDCGWPRQLLRAVEAKRQLVEMYQAILETGGFVGQLYQNAAEPALRLLASEWSDHEQFREEWKP